MSDAANPQADVPQATPDPARSLAVDTPVAKPLPRREVITRRVFLLGGFWSGMSLAIVGLLGGPLDFLWPRDTGGFGGPITLPPDRIPAAGDDPQKIFEGRFYILNIEEGADDSPGGLLALYQKCPHLGCTVPYRPGFTFEQRKGWFRCPCHGSTYNSAGVRVFGPAPRSMDHMAVTIDPSSGRISVNTGAITKGTPDNATFAVQA
jgi:cytochrome b6-f complex iron-sulfur subunit